MLCSFNHCFTKVSGYFSIVWVNWASVVRPLHDHEGDNRQYTAEWLHTEGCSYVVTLAFNTRKPTQG